MAESERQAVDEIIAHLHAWQEFALHPCWTEWRAELQIDLEVANMQLREGVHPLDIVGFGVARTQYAALESFIRFPEDRVFELKALVARLEVLEGKEST